MFLRKKKPHRPGAHGPIGAERGAKNHIFEKKGDVKVKKQVLCQNFVCNNI